MPEFFGKLPPIEQISDPTEYGKALVACSKSASIFAEQFLGLEVFDYNKVFLDCEDRFIVYRTGRQVGKSTNAAIKAIHFGFFAPLKASNLFEGMANIVIASVTKDQAYLIFEKISNFIHKSPTLTSKIKYETKSELSLKWFNGQGFTKFVVRAIGDTGVSLRGYTTHMAILDEAAYIPQVVFDSFLPSTVTTKPIIIFASTPKLKAGAFFNACENSSVIYRKGIPYPILDEQGNPRVKGGKYKWTQFHVKTRDNPMASSDPEILELLASTSKGAEAQELDGEFLEGGNSLISYNILQEALIQAPRQKFVYYDMGVDTSGKGKDETVLMVVGVTESGIVFPVDCYTEITTDQVELSKTIDKYDKIYHFRRIFVDSTGIGDTLIDILKHYNSNLPIYPIQFKESKTELYKNFQRLFENRLINLSLLEQFHRAKLVDQIQGMYWEHGKDRDSPEKVRSITPHDDYPDATGLACMGQEKGDEYVVIPDDFLGSW